MPTLNRRVRAKIESVTNTEQVDVNETIRLDIPKPASELEIQLAKRLGWNDYFFQFPKITKYTTKQVKRLNLDSEQIEFLNVTVSEKHAETTEKRSAWRHFDKRNRNELHVRFAEYCRHLDLPLNFKSEFPYLWAIIQDQYLVNLANSRNLIQMKRKLRGLIKLNIDFSTLMFYQHHLLKNLPDYQMMCLDDPFFKMFMGDVGHMMKLMYSRGMRESTFNDLVAKTIEATNRFKLKK